MAPFNLQGLNVVQSAPAPPTQESSDPLASPFPDFSAQLDLWTNLAFESDEPLAPNNGKRKLADEEDESPPPLGLPNQDSHENVIHPRAAPNSTALPQNLHIPFDINAFLAGFGIDPLLMPPPQPAPIQSNSANRPPPVPSLAQLLALHAAHGSTYAAPPPPPLVPAQLQQPQVASSTQITHSTQTPPPKRARTQKTSSSPDNSETRSPSSPQSDDPTQADPAVTTLSAAEDKRRRNTAASARFRLKKKEREAALEHRAKQLEERVIELERECEGLRRENGWLKGLVVGVTGAGAAQQQQGGAK